MVYDPEQGDHKVRLTFKTKCVIVKIVIMRFNNKGLIVRKTNANAFK